MLRGGPVLVRRCRDLVTGGAPRRSAPPDAHNPSYSPFSVWAAQPAPGQQNTRGAFWAGMGAGWAGAAWARLCWGALLSSYGYLGTGL